MGFRLPPRQEPRRRRRVVLVQGLEMGLERRSLLTATVATTPVVMDSATTIDSHGVTIDYDVVTPPTASHPLTFGIYRSAQNTFDASAIAVGSETIATGASTTLDSRGNPAGAVGHHELSIPLPAGLTLNPEHPYVLAVANPTAALASGNPKATAAFKVDTIVVVSHGGLQLARYDSTGPPWEQVMAYDLRQQGYNTVIPFNWVAASNTAGSAAKQAPRLTQQVLAAAAQFPAGDVVDLQLIGHSEGTVVNAQAIPLIEAGATPGLKAGWLEETMLDPHAANTGVPGQQYSVSGILAPIAKWEIDAYQSKAKDPAVTVPAGVDQAQVFYQHTPANQSQGENNDVYNLWGQVPVIGPASYFNLTADRVTHSGSTAVYTWYDRNIVPTLGNGAPGVAADTLTASSPGNNPSHPHQPEFAGTTAPGSFIKVMVAPAAAPNDLTVDGRAVAGTDGTWSVTAQPLHDGRYRVLAIALPARHTPNRLSMVPTTPMESIVVDA